jgi:AcrR family transcriptional regulator
MSYSHTWSSGRPSHATTRRAELFDQLLTLVLAEGFADLTIDECATRLRCSKTTLYTLAGSREQLIKSTVVHFFRGAAERIEAQLETVNDPRERLGKYLMAVAGELKPASAEFYERNTILAARRVRQLIAEGIDAGVFRRVNGALIAEVTASTMVRIQRRQIYAVTGLADAQAYTELADLLLRGVLA